MKVWPNRLPVSMIDAWAERARREGVTGSALLRQVMAEALARPERIMPITAPTPVDCGHDTGRRTVGYSSICAGCGAVVS